MTGDSKDISDALDELFDIAEERAGGGLKEITTPLYDELQDCSERYCDRIEIARGGMKRILRVFDVKSNRYVAMAMLHHNANKASYDEFIREARLTAMLEHPNIISVYDIGIDDLNPYFTMELKIGDSLDHIIKQRRVDCDFYKNCYSLEKLLEIFVKICDAVAFAHSKKVLHLDLKPENIQVGEYGEVIVCDWGLGKVIGTADEYREGESGLFDPDMLNNITISGEMKGTPGFMAPEQIVRGGSKSVATDIYALGCVLYCILADKPPFSGESATVLQKTLDGEIIPPTRVCRDREVPQSLNAVVLKAMSTEPEDRYASVDELRLEVHNYLSGHSTLAENAGIVKELVLVYRRNRSVCLSLLGSLALIVLLTGMFIRGLNQSKKAAEQARDEAEEAREVSEMDRRRAEYDQKRYFEMLQALKKERRSSQYESDHKDPFSVALFSFIHPEAYDTPARSLRDLLTELNGKIQKNPGEKKLYVMRGMVHFLMFDYTRACKDFEVQCDEWFYRRIYTVAKKYRHFQKQRYLPTTVVISTIQDLSDNIAFDKVALLLAKYDRTVRRSTREHARIVHAVLKVLNPEWKQKEFIFDEKSLSLTLRGKGLYRLGLYQLNQTLEKRVSVIQTLKLKRLVVSGTDLVDVDYLFEPDLEEIDMRQTLVRYIGHLSDFPSMKRIIVSPDQISSSQLEHARKSVEVIVK